MSRRKSNGHFYAHKNFLPPASVYVNFVPRTCPSKGKFLNLSRSVRNELNINPCLPAGRLADFCQKIFYCSLKKSPSLLRNVFDISIESMDESQAYENYLKAAAVEYESQCKQCGACCGLYENDPCEHLKKSEDDKYVCSIYHDRFGIHKTVNGNEFKCVTLRRIRFGSWAGSWKCGYKKAIKNEELRIKFLILNF